ncbi:MAG: hypothetical protein Q9174_006778 [Haloplaca sp. 1 TL-2023]
MHVSTLIFPLASLLLVPSLAIPTAQTEDVINSDSSTAPVQAASDPQIERCLNMNGKDLDPTCWDILKMNDYMKAVRPVACPAPYSWGNCFLNQRIGGWGYKVDEISNPGTFDPPPEIKTLDSTRVWIVYGAWSIWFLHHYLTRLADEINSGGIAPGEGQTIVDAKTLSTVLNSDQAPGAADPQLRELGKKVAFIILALDVATGVETNGLDFLERVLDDALSGPESDAFLRMSAAGGLIHSQL